MSNITKMVTRFIRDDEGTELVEWGLIAGLIITVIAAAFVTMGNDLNTISQALQAQIAAAAG